MRKIKSLIILIIISNFIYGQNNSILKIKVKDKLDDSPISNVNVKIVNTNFGASTSEKGYCEIKVKSLDLSLQFSHLSYQTKILEIKKELINDTINIYLEQKQIQLEEFNIKAEIGREFKDRENLIIDFNNIKNKILILERNKNSLNKYRLLLTNSFFDIQKSYSIKKNIKPTNIFKDGLGNCYLITKDSAYQIILADSSLHINFPTEITKFHKVIDDCLFSTDSLIFFQHIYNNGYSYLFYSINKYNKKFKKFMSNNDYERFSKLQERINYLIKHPPKSSLQDAINFEKMIMYKPFKQELIKVADSIYYLNYQNSLIEIYSKNCKYCRNININYHLNTNWDNNIIYDEEYGKIYTLMNKSLFEINLINGKINKKKKINFSKKIIINKGNAYILKSDYYMDKPNFYIKKIRL